MTASAPSSLGCRDASTARRPTLTGRGPAVRAGSSTVSVDVPIVLQDERLTSSEADELLARRERDWRKRKRSSTPWPRH